MTPEKKSILEKKSKTTLRETRLNKQIGELDETQRTPWESLISGGKESARRQMHARILWKADQRTDGPAWSDERIAETLEVGQAAVERVRWRVVQGGLLDALVRRQQPERPEQRNRDGELEARLVTVASSQTEGGRTRWTMRLLAEKVVPWGLWIRSAITWCGWREKNERTPW
jgi:hypothetical protein